jgi:hypothetical protein
MFFLEGESEESRIVPRACVFAPFIGVRLVRPAYILGVVRHNHPSSSFASAIASTKSVSAIYALVIDMKGN